MIPFGNINAQLRTAAGKLHLGILTAVRVFLGAVDSLILLGRINIILCQHQILNIIQYPILDVLPHLNGRDRVRYMEAFQFLK